MFCIINADFDVQLKSTNHNARQTYEVGAEGEKMRASYRNLQFVSTNQLTRWKSNQPITFKGNFCFELWLVKNVARLTQQRKNRLVNITLASSSCFSSFVVFLLACVRDLFNSLYCSAKKQCCNVVKNIVSCALFDNRLPPCPCISCSSYFLSDFVTLQNLTKSLKNSNSITSLPFSFFSCSCNFEIVDSLFSRLQNKTTNRTRQKG